MIGAFRSSHGSIVPASSCSLSGPLLYRSPVVVFLDRGYPCVRNFNSTIPVDVVRVKSYVNCFLDPTCVPVRISINKLDLIPDRIVAGLVGVFRNDIYDSPVPRPPPDIFRPKYIDLVQSVQSYRVYCYPATSAKHFSFANTTMDSVLNATLNLARPSKTILSRRMYN